MSRLAKTASLSALVTGGLALGWMLTRTPSAITPARTFEIASAPVVDAAPSALKSVFGEETNFVSLSPTASHPAVSAHRAAALPATDSSTFNFDAAPVVQPGNPAQPVEKSRASAPRKTLAGAAVGFAPLPLPGLKQDGERLAVSAITVPAVLAAGHTQVALTPAQKAGLEALADDFSERAGEPPADISAAVNSDFAVNAYIAATEADFLIRQRYGHRAYVQMQMEAHSASLAR